MIRDSILLLTWVFCASFPLAAQKPPTYTPTPDHLTRGKTVEVAIKDGNCPDQQNTLTPDVQVILPEGSGTKLVDKPVDTADPCPSKLVKIAVDGKATLGVLNIRLVLPGAGGAAQSFLAPVTVVDEPEVDVSWYVMPAKILKDNFGHYIGSRYYGIEVVIGNQSGNDLLISSIEFKTPTCLDVGKIGKVEKGEKVGTPACVDTLHLILPNTSYKIARGTLEKEQVNGPRTLLINSIKAAGLVTLGFTPFFHAPVPKQNFTTAINILSDPFEKGLELAIPDTISDELKRLDDQYLRDGTIIHVEDQVRTRVFVARHVVSELLPKGSSADNEMDVAAALGSLQIIGTKIEYGPRVHVGTAAANAPAAPATTAAGATAAPPQ
jgi:hypothetical protein